MNNQLLLICPLCNQLLQNQKQQLKCKNNHSFDIAKEKYVNLNINGSANSGDDKEMLIARNNFLNKGYYNEIANALNNLIKEDINKKPQNSLINIIDAGCGEGYYLNYLNMYLNSLINISYYGFDISKSAVKMAAKRNKNINWFVANAFNMPIQSNSIDYFISMFSFYSLAEIARTLKNDGKVIIFRAGKKHLIELKDILYNELTLKESNIELNNNFQIFEEINLLKTIEIKGYENLENLLHMTPHYYKTKLENKELLKKYQSLNITIDVDIYILTKK